MLGTLTADKSTVRTRDAAPTHPTAWLQAVPVPPPSKNERFELAPGIWIVRERQWWPVSVLDVAADLPWDYGARPTPRIYPFPAWHRQAACAGVKDYDALFFGVDDTAHPALPPRFFRAARAICARCPVAEICLTQAMTQPELFGIWAGTTGRQRAKLRAKLRSGQTVSEVVHSWLTR